jgi:histidine triad (HIT) family protein
MEGCLFCAIAAGDIPSSKVYEDEYVYAFRDINPQAPVHVLVIPKAHIVSAAEVDSNNSVQVAKCFEAVSKIASELRLDSGFRVISNCGEDAAQSVKHLHFHILAGKFLGERLV